MTDQKDSRDDFEIGEEEGFNSQEQQFSHQVLVMKCLNKCIDAGSQEMVIGRFETKKDSQGRETTKYYPDTRRAFIESVKTAKCIMACDFDEEAEKKIKGFIGEVQFNKDHWLKKEWEWWTSLDYGLQGEWIKKNQGVIQGMHNAAFHFLNLSIDDELDIWRDVLEELNQLTKRLNFYEADIFTA